MTRYAGLFERLLANSTVEECEWADAEVIEGRGPCWQWNAFRTRRGYGRCARRVAGRPYPVSFFAHRCMAEVILERQPTNDETIDHACAIPWCISPYHLRVMGRGENTSDARRRKLGRPRREYAWLVPSMPPVSKAA